MLILFINILIKFILTADYFIFKTVICLNNPVFISHTLHSGLRFNPGSKIPAEIHREHLSGECQSRMMSFRLRSKYQ